MSNFSNALNRMGSNLSPGSSLASAVAVDRINAIMDALRALGGGDLLTGSGNVTVTGSGGKYTLSSKPGGRRGVASAAVKYPFDVESFSGTEEENTFTVRTGTVNGLIPANMNTTFSGTGYLVLNVTSTAGAISTAALALEGAAPTAWPVTMGMPPVTVKILLGVVGPRQWIRTHGTGSVVMSVVRVYETVKLNPTPGEFPYVLHYTWEVKSA